MTHVALEEPMHSNIMELRALLAIAFKTLHGMIEKQLAEHVPDMSRLQFSILMILAHDEDQTISELSRKLVVDPSTLVPSVDALERKGLVVRQRDPNDRRRIPLQLTEDAVALLRTIRTVHKDDPIIPCLQNLGEEQLHQLISLLCALIHNLPEGENLLKTAQSRLFAYGAKEKYLICRQHED